MGCDRLKAQVLVNKAGVLFAKKEESLLIKGRFFLLDNRLVFYYTARVCATDDIR